MSVIKIKPMSGNHGQFLMFIGLVSLLVTIALSHQWWAEIKLVLMFLGVVSVVCFFIGLVKKLEPEYSLLLTKEGIEYQHKYGKWQVQWLDIQRIGNVSITVGLDKRTLPYVGIKLKNELPLVNSLSRRLASRLPHEQRPLTTAAVIQNQLTIEQAQINFTPFVTSDKQELKGPIAFCMHHVHALSVAYGYHIFIPASALDRPVDDFINLLKDCKRHTEQHPSEE